jgi:hypothetical protein
VAASVRQLVVAADAKGLPARLRVLRVNPARQLNERLGFVVTGQTETHFLMEHAVPRDSTAARRQGASP